MVGGALDCMETKSESQGTGEIKNKDQYIQMMRGIAIILVVLIHSKNGLNSTSLELYYWIVLRQVINFAVPLFFSISGFLAVKSLASGKKWGCRRYRRLVVPYLVWSIIYILIGGIKSITTKSIVSKLLFGMSSMQMYFVIVLIELTVITPLLYGAISKKRSWFLLLTSPLYYCLLYILFFKNGNIHYALGRNLIPWFSYYYLGMIYANTSMRPKKSISLAMILAGLLLSIIEGLAFELIYKNPEMAVTQLKMSSFIFSVGVISIFECLHENDNNKKNKVLIMIGNASYGIFFIHPLIIRIENKIAILIGVYDVFLPIYEISQCLITIIVSYAIVIISQKIDKHNDICWALGFNT